MLNEITVLILTYNEEKNIERTLQALKVFKDIVVIDSFSDDHTPEIVASFSNTRMFKNKFQGHAKQWNYGLVKCGLEAPWVLALDADYVVSKSFVDELSNLRPESSVAGFRANFRYCIHGRELRGTLYPAHVVLFRQELGTYVQEGHTQRLLIDGAVGELRSPIYHDDRKPLSRWIVSQQRYAGLEAEYILSFNGGKSRSANIIRKLGWPAPLLVFFYTLIWKGCILDGWPGWMYVLQRTLAEIMIALEILDKKIRNRPAINDDCKS